MFNTSEGVSLWSVCRWAFFIALAAVAAFCAEPAKESTANSPKVTAVIQITHDGISKANLVSDESDLNMAGCRRFRYIEVGLIRYQICLAVIQITNDGIIKANMVSDHSDLYVS